jgi:cytoskeleton protein RodZ
MRRMAIRDQRGLPIGEVLRGARSRLGLDIFEVERATRIRAKYLWALENEEWDVLPGPTYVKGYLGLDAEALVGEYRRTIERSPASEQPYLFSEPLLERRRRTLEPRRRSWGTIFAVVGVIALAVVAVVAVVRIDPLDWFSASGTGAHGKGRHARHHHGSTGHKRGGSEKGGSSGQAVSLALITHDEMVVCLLPGHGRPLIDSQTLVADSKQGPFEPPAENYRLDLISGGTITVVLGGKPQRLHSRRPASYEIDASGIREIPFQGTKCP